MIKCLCDKIKWGKWWRHCDVALGYYWSNDLLEGGSSASIPQWTTGNWNCEQNSIWGGGGEGGEVAGKTTVVLYVPS